MNIFLLSTDPEVCARDHCDKHVVKMATEYAQILSTAATLMGHEHSCYRPTHAKHPCVQWAAENTDNWRWLLLLAIYTGREYSARYHRVHKATEALCKLPVGLLLGDTPMPTKWPMCVADDCIQDDPVGAYRDYYRKHKAYFATWRAPSKVPGWFNA